MPSRLLIADDSTTIQKVFERTFSPEEFALTFAKNGEEALAKAKEDKPDLIIADINMPGKNGFEVCEEVKKDSSLKDTPVLLLIGILDDFDEDESHRVGADGFIVKPFEANSAINKVREALGKGEIAVPAQEAPAVPPPVEEPVAAPPLVEEPVAPPPLVEEGVAAAPPVGEPAPGEAEEVLELVDVVEEPAAAETPAAMEAPFQEKKEEEFVLETPLRDLETELKEQYTEGEVEKKEEPLSLDLPIDEMESETFAEAPERESLFGEFGVEEAGKEMRDERLETILDESATEMERIEGLPPKKEEMEEEKEERFMETFEPVFEAKKVGLEPGPALEKGLEGALKEAIEGMAEKLATTLSRALRETLEETLKETVPELVRQEMERLKKG